MSVRARAKQTQNAPLPPESQLSRVLRVGFESAAALPQIGAPPGLDVVKIMEASLNANPEFLDWIVPKMEASDTDRWVILSGGGKKKVKYGDRYLFRAQIVERLMNEYPVPLDTDKKVFKDGFTYAAVRVYAYGRDTDDDSPARMKSITQWLQKAHDADVAYATAKINVVGVLLHPIDHAVPETWAR